MESVSAGFQRIWHRMLKCDGCRGASALGNKHESATRVKRQSKDRVPNIQIDTETPENLTHFPEIHKMPIRK